MRFHNLSNSSHTNDIPTNKGVFVWSFLKFWDVLYFLRSHYF